MDNYNVVISSKAQSDLSECVSFVLNVSKEAGKSIANSIFDSISSLCTFPERNPVFEMPKQIGIVFRKQVVEKRYIIIYSIESMDVVVYRILDARRKFDSLI